MKEEALKLADESQRQSSLVYLVADEPIAKQMSQMFLNYSAMIRRLVEEVDSLEYDLKSLAKRYKALNRTKPLSDEEIKAIENSVKYSELALSNDEYMLKFARAIEERHGIK